MSIKFYVWIKVYITFYSIGIVKDGRINEKLSLKDVLTNNKMADKFWPESEKGPDIHLNTGISFQ